MPVNISDKKGSGARWPNTRRHAKIYPGRLSRYAALHGVSLHTIGSWIRRGKEVGRLPPLTSKAAIARWKRRWYGTRCPARYPQPHTKYAVIHGVDRRTIVRMVKRGKDVRCLPPLGDPVKLKKWRSRYMRHGQGEQRAQQMWLIDSGATARSREIFDMGAKNKPAKPVTP